jgi:hypothetical protein
MDKSTLAILVYVFVFIVSILVYAAWAAARSTSTKLSVYDRGYDFARKKPLSGELTANQLLEKAHTGLSGLPDFDRGVKQAVRDYVSDARKINDVQTYKESDEP